MVSSSTYTQGDHFVETTVMGESNNGTAVVDTNTKVFVTDNLFVVDASIHPDLVSTLQRKSLINMLTGNTSLLGTRKRLSWLLLRPQLSRSLLWAQEIRQVSLITKIADEEFCVKFLLLSFLYIAF
jgi:hypothetical protein